MDIPEFLWYGEKNTKGGTVMKELTAILAFLMLLTSCGQSQDSSDSPSITSVDNTTISAEEKEVITTTSTAMTVMVTTITTTEIQSTTAAIQETTAVNVTEPVSAAETAETPSEAQSTPDTAQAAETPQTEALAATAAERTTISQTTTKTVQQTVPTTTVIVTEPPTEAHNEPKTVLPNDGTDYGKAKAVYDCMIENGHGTCVNYACQTYELCHDIGLDCYIVWTSAELYGHVANIVNVDGVWYVLDTEGGYFLDYNYCFTEVVDIDGNHIADSDIISGYSYNELH